MCRNRGLVRLLARTLGFTTVMITTSLSGSLFASAPAAEAAGEDRNAYLPRLAVEREGALFALPLRETHIEMNVSGFIATGEISQRYENTFEEPIEVIYVFPLPRKASVHGYSMHVGGLEIAGEIKRREEAAKAYERARRAGHTAAVLDQHRRNVFEQKVANVPPGETIEIHVQWDQPLDYEAGSFSLVVPTVVAPRYTSPRGTRPDTPFRDPPIVMPPDELDHELSMSIELDAGVSIQGVDSPSHDLFGIDLDDRRASLHLADWEGEANRDFVLKWRVAREHPVLGALTHVDERGGFFSMMLVPPIPAREERPPPREIVFVVDVSGSMRGLPLHLCKEAMLSALDGLRPEDTFEIITFAGYPTELFGQPRSATKERIDKARRFVSELHASGGTEMMDAVHAALGPELEADRHRFVFFLTDGLLRNEQQILAVVREHTERHDRKERRARVFSFGVGSSINRHLIDGLAQAGRGAAIYGTNRENPEEAVKRFYELIDNPVLSSVRMDWGTLPVNPESLFPGSIGDLRTGQPLLLHGRYDASGEDTVSLRGRTCEGDTLVLPFDLDLSSEASDDPALPRVWARAKIAELTKSLWSEHPRGNPKRLSEVKEVVAEVGLDFGLVTSETSFVAVDRSRRVGDGSPLRIEQPVSPPEDIDPIVAGGRPWGGGGIGARGATLGSGSSSGAIGIGGFGSRGSSGRGSGHGAGSYVLTAKRGSTGTGAGSTSIKMDVLEVEGNQREELVRRDFQRHRTQVRYCYELERQRRPTIEGKIVVEIEVGPDGRVRTVNVVEEESDLDNEGIRVCLQRRIQTWMFPASGSGAEGRAQVEISFTE